MNDAEDEMVLANVVRFVCVGNQKGLFNEWT